MSYSAPVVVEPPPPPPPAISIGDAMIAEGGQLQFTLTLDTASANPVTVAYATANGTADGADYTAVATTLTFAPGERSKTIVVATTGDGVVEPNETLTVTLSAPTGATLADAEATAPSPMTMWRLWFPVCAWRMPTARRAPRWASP